MQKILRFTILICSQLVFLHKITAQLPENSDYAEIGKPMPYFKSFKNLLFFQKITRR